MTKDLYRITKHEQLTQNVYRLIVEGDTSAIVRPGQFVNIEIEGFYLRRPISISDYDDKTISLIYKVVGEGTEALTHYKEGKQIDLLVGLGNGFDTDTECKYPLVVGGGVGIPPLLKLTKELISKGKKPVVIICFNTKEEIFLHDEFKLLGVDVWVTTVDGSYGTKGFYSDAIREGNIRYDYYYTCGPLAMLKSIHSNIKTQGQISFEERMGCGFGGCMGCSHKTKNGYKRVCTDTTMNSDEVLFD